MDMDRILHKDYPNGTVVKFHVIFARPENGRIGGQRVHSFDLLLYSTDTVVGLKSPTTLQYSTVYGKGSHVGNCCVDGSGQAQWLSQTTSNVGRDNAPPILPPHSTLLRRQ